MGQAARLSDLDCTLSSSHSGWHLREDGMALKTPECVAKEVPQRRSARAEASGSGAFSRTGISVLATLCECLTLESTIFHFFHCVPNWIAHFLEMDLEQR